MKATKELLKEQHVGSYTGLECLIYRGWQPNYSNNMEYLRGKGESAKGAAEAETTPSELGETK